VWGCRPELGDPHPVARLEVDYGASAAGVPFGACPTRPVPQTLILNERQTLPFLGAEDIACCLDDGGDFVVGKPCAIQLGLHPHGGRDVG
jgi:hypothetical protein